MNWWRALLFLFGGGISISISSSDTNDPAAAVATTTTTTIARQIMTEMRAPNGMNYYTDPYALFCFTRIEEAFCNCGGPQSFPDFARCPIYDHDIARAIVSEDQANANDGGSSDNGSLDDVLRGIYDNRLSLFQKTFFENAAAAERSMKAVIAKSSENGIPVTTKPPGCDSAVIDYWSTKDDGFFDWMGFDNEIDQKRHAHEPILRDFQKRMVGCPNDDSSFEDCHDYASVLDWIEQGEYMYGGHRDLLEPIIRKNWERMDDDFRPIPEETAKWCVERVKGVLMPVLRDENHVYLSLPSSAYNLPRTKELAMPTPYKSRTFGTTTTATTTTATTVGGDDNDENNNYDYGIWFEDQDNNYAMVASESEGGTYVMGLDGEVLIFSVDGPGDVIRARWKCGNDQWERMWEESFGSTTIRADDGSDYKLIE